MRNINNTPSREARSINSLFFGVIMKKNYVEDLLTVEELKEYQEKDWPENLPILHKALLKKLETEPDYEVWVPVKYVRYNVLTDGIWRDYHFKYAWVSNKGNYYFHRSKPRKKLPKGTIINGYVSHTVTLDSRNIRFMIHRAVACSFVPINNEFKDKKMEELQVNHIDTIKINNDFRNLEWCTGEHNTNHAFDN